MLDKHSHRDLHKTQVMCVKLSFCSNNDLHAALFQKVICIIFIKLSSYKQNFWKVESKKIKAAVCSVILDSAVFRQHLHVARLTKQAAFEYQMPSVLPATMSTADSI